MLKVIETLKIGNLLSVTVEGNPNEIKNGAVFVDKNGDRHTVKSIALERFDNPHDISRFTTFLTEFCELKKGSILFSE